MNWIHDDVRRSPEAGEEMKLKSKVLGGVVGAGILTGAIAVGAAAAASSPDSIPAANGVITGCYKASTGALSVINAATSHCPARSVTLTWNKRGLTGARGAPGAAGPRGATGAAGQRGPQGPTGAQGPQGAQGPKGDTGAAGSAIAAGVVEPSGTTPFFSLQGLKGWKAVTTPQNFINGEYCLTPADGINARANTLELSVVTNVPPDASHPEFFGAVGSAIWEGYCNNGGFQVVTYATGYFQGDNIAFDAVIP